MARESAQPRNICAIAILCIVVSPAPLYFVTPGPDPESLASPQKSIAYEEMEGLLRLRVKPGVTPVFLASALQKPRSAKPSTNRPRSHVAQFLAKFTRSFL